MVPHLAARGDLDVVAVDQRGHGESSWATLDTYDAVSYAADIAALIEALELSPAVVVGHSLGGVVAAALGAARPDLLRGLFLEDPPMFEGDAARRAASPAAKLFPAMVTGVRELQALNAPPEDYAQFADPGTDRHEVADYCASLPDWDPTTMEAAVAGVLWRDFDPSAPLPSPVTLVRADPAVRTVFGPDDAERLAATSPHARIIEVPGAGHSIHASPTRAAYLDHLDTFLDTL